MAYKIRMFMEPGVGQPLRQVLHQGPVPRARSVDGELLEQLPISETLRERLRGWADDWVSVDSGSNDQSLLDDFDLRGLILSRSLQRELGPEYAIVYEMLFDEWSVVHDDLVAEPCEGWSIRPLVA